MSVFQDLGALRYLMEAACCAGELQVYRTLALLHKRSAKLARFMREELIEAIPTTSAFGWECCSVVFRARNLRTRRVAHSKNDEAASFYSNNESAFNGPWPCRVWRRLGKIHRGNDKPAIMHSNGAMEWWQNNERKRDGGKPVIVTADGPDWESADESCEGKRVYIDGYTDHFESDTDFLENLSPQNFCGCLAYNIYK